MIKPGMTALVFVVGLFTVSAGRPAACVGNDCNITGLIGRGEDMVENRAVGKAITDCESKCTESFCRTQGTENCGPNPNGASCFLLEEPYESPSQNLYIAWAYGTCTCTQGEGDWWGEPMSFGGRVRPPAPGAAAPKRTAPRDPIQSVIDRLLRRKGGG